VASTPEERLDQLRLRLTELDKRIAKTERNRQNRRDGVERLKRKIREIRASGVNQVNARARQTLNSHTTNLNQKKRDLEQDHRDLRFANRQRNEVVSAMEELERQLAPVGANGR
jgi:chromosome segregation ATPase